jgi:hypothetical protein
MLERARFLQRASHRGCREQLNRRTPRPSDSPAPPVLPVERGYPAEGGLVQDVPILEFLLCRNRFSLPARSLEAYAPSPRE